MKLINILKIKIKIAWNFKQCENSLLFIKKKTILNSVQIAILLNHEFLEEPEHVITSDY